EQPRMLLAEGSGGEIALEGRDLDAALLEQTEDEEAPKLLAQYPRELRTYVQDMQCNRLVVGKGELLMLDDAGAVLDVEPCGDVVVRLDRLVADLDEARREAGARDLVADRARWIAGQNPMDLGFLLDEHAATLVSLHRPFVDELAQSAPDGDGADVDLLHQFGETRQSSAPTIGTARNPGAQLHHHIVVEIRTFGHPATSPAGQRVSSLYI